jgi:hypothetical protein
MQAEQAAAAAAAAAAGDMAGGVGMPPTRAPAALPHGVTFASNQVAPERSESAETKGSRTSYTLDTSKPQSMLYVKVNVTACAFNCIVAAQASLSMCIISRRQRTCFPL